MDRPDLRAHCLYEYAGRNEGHTEDEWKGLSEGLNRLGECAREKGMALTCHHRMGIGVQTAEEIHHLMESTPGGLLDLLYNTGYTAPRLDWATATVPKAAVNAAASFRFLDHENAAC